MKNILISFCLAVVSVLGFLAFGEGKIYWQDDSLATDARSIAKDPQILFVFLSQGQSIWKEIDNSPVASKGRLQIESLSPLADDRKKAVKNSNPFSLNYHLMINQMILKREGPFLPK